MSNWQDYRAQTTGSSWQKYMVGIAGGGQAASLATQVKPSPTTAQPTQTFGQQFIGMPLGGMAGAQTSIQAAQKLEAEQEQPFTPLSVPYLPFPEVPTLATKTTPLDIPYARLTGLEEYPEGVATVELVPVKDEIRTFGQSLEYLPEQIASSVLQAIQGEGGASVVNRDWADEYIHKANTNLEEFVASVARQYPYSNVLLELAQLPRNLSYSVTSMGTGMLVALPLWLVPEPTGGTKAAAMVTTGAVSGYIAYRMTTYQITQTYLEFKNLEKINRTGQGLTLEEENQLKADFHSKAVKYGLWEAIPEGISNMLFSGILTGAFTNALTKVVGQNIAGQMGNSLIARYGFKALAMYGEELLTETITQKGQAAIEVEAGLREGSTTWWEAFKEIAPQTFLLTTVMGGAGQVIVSTPKAINKIKTALKNEIGEENPLYNVLVDGVEDYYETVTGVEPTITEVPTTATTGETFTGTVYRGETTTPTDEGLVGKGQYWSTDPAYAATYGPVTESTVTLRNPLAINTQREFGEFGYRTRELRDIAIEQGRDEGWVQTELRRQLEAEGYDGVVIAEGIVEKGKQVAVFHPEESITEYAPTTAMAEWETVSGKATVKYEKGSVGDAVRAAKELKAKGNLFVYPTGEGMAIAREAPPFGIQYIIIKPDGTHQVVSAGASFTAGRRAGVEPVSKAPVVTPEAVKPTAIAVEITAPVTGFEGLESTTEGEAITEVAGAPPKIPTNWDKVGGDLYDRFKKQVTPNPTPNTAPLSDRLRRAWGIAKTYVADEFARLNELGWQAEVDVAMVRAADSKSAQLYKGTMKAVSESLNNDSNLLSYVDDYLMLRHQLEVLKATGRKRFTLVKGPTKTQFTDKQIGLLFAQMKKELGEANYAKVKEAASHFPAVYNQILRENQELTPGQIEGLIRKYPWFNPIVFKGESSPVNIGHRLSPRQIKQLTTLETDREQLSPLLSLPTTIARRMKAQAINEARRSVSELAVDPKNKTLIGGDTEIVFKKPEGVFIDFYDEGQRRYLKLGKGTEWIARDIDLLQRQPPNMIIRGVRSLQNISKMFFTTYNPGFVVWNTAFDAYTSYFAEGISPFGFGKALAGNIKAMFAEVPAVTEFRKAGGELFGFFTRGADIGKEGAITPFVGRKEGRLVLLNPEGLKRFINPFTLIRELGIAGENAARRATFEKAKRERLSDKEAALRARRVTVDFSRFSKASRIINDFYIYFNPALQGFMLPGRAIRKDPRSLWRLSTLIMAYAGLVLYNMSYDEYDDVRDSDKVGKLLVMLPSDEYNKYGQKVPHYLTLMPMREFAFFTAPIEYLIGRLRTEEPEAYRTLAQEWDVLYPVISPLSMISETGGLVFPTQIGATLQQIINNHDDFRDRDIVDDEMELLPPSQQYDQYTNGLAIKIGQALDMSPKKLDFFASNMFGALGNDLLREVNRAIETIDREQVDERIAGLVSDLREIPITVPPNQIEVARETFLEGLAVEDRDLVLNMENLPDDQIPFVQSVFRRFFRDYGGQVYATAKEKALMNRALEDYPPEALAKLQKDAVENANNLLNDKITKKQYDDARTRYRAYFSGASTAQWREGMTEGAVARSEIDKYMPEAYQRSEEFQAVSAYMEIRQKYIDEAGGVFDSEMWDKIENQTLTDLRLDYSEQAIQYAIVHKDDWIDNLPEPARTVERQRAAAIENETWWDEYSGETTGGGSSWQQYGSGATSGGSSWQQYGK